MFPLEIWHLVIKHLPLSSYFQSAKLLVPPPRTWKRDQLRTAIDTLFSHPDSLLIIWWLLRLDLTTSAMKFHIYTAVKATARRGDRALLNWLIVNHKDVAAKMSEIILKTAVQHGQPQLVSWLFPLCCHQAEIVEATCRGASKVGNLRALTLCRPHMTLDMALAAFVAAVARGQLPVLRWLRMRFDIRKGDLAVTQRSLAFLLERAANGGHLDVLIWLTTTFSITADEANAWGCAPLRVPVQEGNLRVLRWWCKTFPFEDSSAVTLQLQSWAITGGHWPVIHWLTYIQ
jgi:hypothetical protein